MNKYRLDDVYISEQNYNEDMKNIVEPFLNDKIENGCIIGHEDVNLYYENYKVENAKGNIVIIHGYTENLERYHEIIYYFLKDGYNVFGIEHRGHGRSGKLGIADEGQIYVKEFNQYVYDLKCFMDQVVIPNNENKKVLLFAHSMGGGVCAKFLEDYPKYFDAAILNAPMLEVNTGNIPKHFAKIIVKSAVLIGKGGEYVLGKKPYSPGYNPDKIGTSSIKRYEYSDNIIADDEELQRGGASYNWTHEAFKLTKEITKQENASKVKIPVLIFQAEYDWAVMPSGQNQFAKHAPDCKVLIIKNSRHEIFLERDEILKPYLEEVLNFYNRF